MILLTQGRKAVKPYHHVSFWGSLHATEDKLGQTQPPTPSWAPEGQRSVSLAAAPHKQPPSLVAAMTTLVFWAVGLGEKPSGGWRHQGVSKNLSICITRILQNNRLLLGQPVGASETTPELISNFAVL